MNLGQDFFKDIRNMKQEILNLKQVKKANSASKYYSFEVPGGEEYYSFFEITYKDGEQPIIAEVLSDAATSLSSPSGNKQYLFAYSHLSSSITILSTREIDSVVGIQ